MLSAYQCETVAYRVYRVDDYDLVCPPCARKLVDNDVLWHRAQLGMDNLTTRDGHPVEPAHRVDVDEAAVECHYCGHESPVTCDYCGADLI